MGNKIILIFVLSSLLFAFDKTIDLAGSGMSYSEKGSGMIMDNVVNAKTPGYKEVKQKSVYDSKKGEVITVVSISFLKGPYVNSGKNLDFAIDGKGFFMVQDKSTKRYFFTCDGRFEVNEDRMLVTLSNKFLVLDTDRAPIQIPLYTDVKANDKGTLFDNGSNKIAQLGIVEVFDTKQLSSVNNVFFYLENEDKKMIKVISDETTIRQGFYELSNVDYTRVLAKLADSGKYSANTNIIQTRMKMLDTIIDIVNKQ